MAIKMMRNIVISEDITQEVAKQVISQIMACSHIDTTKGMKYKDFPLQPIYLYLSSFGGCVYSGLSIIDAIRMSTTPIIGVACGMVMSMALPILVSCHVKLCGPNTTFHMHPLSAGMMGFPSQIEVEFSEINRLEDLITGIIVKNTKMTKRKLQSIYKANKNFYMDAKTALNFAIVDEIAEIKIDLSNEETE